MSYDGRGSGLMFYSEAYHRSIANNESLILKVTFFYSKEKGAKLKSTNVGPSKKSEGKKRKVGL